MFSSHIVFLYVASYRQSIIVGGKYQNLIIHFESQGCLKKIANNFIPQYYSVNSHTFCQL